MLNYSLQALAQTKEINMRLRLILIVVLLSLSACGQKGDLFIEADESVNKQEARTPFNSAKPINSEDKDSD